MTICKIIHKDQIMILRQAAQLAQELAGEFKVVAIVGPRQAGKTTLAQMVFSDKPYVNLEDPDQRLFAREDPRRFLALYADGAVIDEMQHCPELFSYLQGIVDQKSLMGQFILTGSQHFGMLERISQSLAGRVGFLRLLPFSLEELENGGVGPKKLDELLLKGGYPPVYDQPVSLERWYNAYIATYVERDVRQLLNVRDLGMFQRFITLCAGNTGQMLNTARLGNDLGVVHNTVRSWLNILETSFITFRLRPHHQNFRKRLVKTPKLYFYDTGLAARLLGIETTEQLALHPMRGPLFENWVVVELLKGRSNSGKADNLFFWRNNTGDEVDVIAEQGGRLLPIEIKSGSTIASDWFKPLVKWSGLAGSVAQTPWLVYGGEQCQTRQDIEVLPWRNIMELTAIN
jgi:predicted AAA+ superfamily ATPase